MDRAAISIIVDHLAVARGWSDAMQRARRALDVLVKVDVGFHRCGIDPDAGPVDFIRQVASMPGLRVRGLEPCRAPIPRDVDDGAGGHRGARSGDPDDAQRAGGVSGVPLDEISVGATPTPRFSAGEPGLTELRPGNYVYFDRTQVGLGSAALEDCALTVLATVVSKASSRPHHPRLRQQDAVERSLANEPGIRRGAHTRRLGHRRGVDDRAPLRGARNRHGARRHNARTRRPRPRPPQPFLRRLEPGGRDPTGRGRSRHRDGAGRRQRQDNVGPRSPRVHTETTGEKTLTETPPALNVVFVNSSEL